jgi:two-component system sensor histidine kinase FlrB
LLSSDGMSVTSLDCTDTKRSELQAAFREFGSVSEQLSEAFDALRSQVAQLHVELGEAISVKDNLAARLGALLKGLPGGVVVLDALDVIVEINPAAEQLLGGPILGQSFTTALAQAAVNADESPEYRELRSGRFVNISRRELALGGEVILLMGELAAGLAHQIRTPLATALLYASQMMLPDRSDLDLRRCAEKTVGSLKQLDRLVNDMLAFAHGGAAREIVSVSALLEQVAQWLRPALRRGVRLTIRTQAPNLMVRANAPSLVSAVLNLATNALQAARADLDLELLARTENDRAQIIVSDNGPGIPPEIRARIFEPFFTTRARGNGIGLSIVKSVIEAHHGSVRLADTGPGATFVIDLPAEESA